MPTANLHLDIIKAVLFCFIREIFAQIEDINLHSFREYMLTESIPQTRYFKNLIFAKWLVSLLLIMAPNVSALP